MSAFTAFLNLVKPGGGSTGLILPDEVVDIDKLNQNFDLIDAFASSWGPAASRNHQFYGPAASLGGVAGMKRGDTYQESDDDFQLWTYNGATWVPSLAYVSLRKTTTQATTAAEVDVTFTASAVNKGFTLPALPASAIPVPAAGDYEISAMASVSQTGGNFFDFRLYANGVVIVKQTGSQYPHTNTVSTAVISPVIVSLTAGQIVKLTAASSSNGQIDANSLFFTMKKVG